jgi:hypothetical protein
MFCSTKFRIVSFGTSSVVLFHYFVSSAPYPVLKTTQIAAISHPCSPAGFSSASTSAMRFNTALLFILAAIAWGAELHCEKHFLDQCCDRTGHENNEYRNPPSITVRKALSTSSSIPQLCVVSANCRSAAAVSRQERFNIRQSEDFLEMWRRPQHRLRCTVSLELCEHHANLFQLKGLLRVMYSDVWKFGLSLR